jgi:hypothetical protein
MLNWTLSSTIILGRAMRRGPDRIMILLAVLLAVLFALFNADPFSFSSSPALRQVAVVAGPVKAGIPVKVRVMHSIEGSPPTPPPPGLVFVVLGRLFSELDAKGEAEFLLQPGNYSLMVSWRDGILYPHRMIVSVDKPLEVIVIFREEKIIPISLKTYVNFTTSSTKIELEYKPPTDNNVYASTPFVSVLDHGGRKMVFPTSERLETHLTPRPYYLRLDTPAGYTLYDVVIPVYSKMEIIIPWTAMIVPWDEVFIPIQLTNATVVEETE